MATTRLSSREFNQDTGRAKRAARKGPVIITERGHPAHVLLTFDAYQRLANPKGNILDALGLPADRVSLAQVTDPNIQSNEVHLYVR